MLAQSVPMPAHINRRRSACARAVSVAACSTRDRGGGRVDKDDSGAETPPSSGGGRGGEGAPIKPSASNAESRSSVQTQWLSLSSSAAATSSLASALAPAAWRQSSDLRCLPPPCCHPPFDHHRKGISNNNGSVNEARDNGGTWGTASMPTHNN
jgi:hypothetical protein